MFLISFLCLIPLSKNYRESSKYPKKDKDHDKDRLHSDTQKRSEKAATCWLYPQTRMRIISKEYKKGKYYNKKVLDWGTIATLWYPQ